MHRLKLTIAGHGIAAADPPAGQPSSSWAVLVVLCLAQFMVTLDVTVVNVALPSIGRGLHFAAADLQWAVTAYVLLSGGLMLLGGRASDLAGRRRVFLCGLALFTAASLASGLAPTAGGLIAARAAQGLGAALLTPAALSIVTTTYSGAPRAAALSAWGAIGAGGAVAGVLAGGILTSWLGWRSVFLINVPVGLLAVVAGWYLLPRTRRAGEPAPRPLPVGHRAAGRAGQPGADLGGMGLLAVSTSTGMLAISSLSGLGLPLWAVATCVVAAATAGAALVRHSWRAAAPLLDLRALAAAGTGPALGGALCAYLVLFGPLVLFPQVVSARGGSAASAGLLLTALPAGFGLAAVAVDRLIPAGWPNRRRCVVGGALAAASAAALAVPAPDAVSVALLGLLGVGLGIYTPANNAEIMASVPARDAAAAGGMVNMTRGIGTALGVAVVSLGLHVGTFLRQPDAGQTLSMAALAAVALVGVWCGQRGGRAGLSPADEPAGRRQMAGPR